MLLRDKLSLSALLLVLSGGLGAEVYEFKDWLWSSSEDGYYFAITVNADGHTFGQYCYFADGDCLYLLTMGVTCVEGDEYPALLNSDYGAEGITLICGGIIDGESVLLIGEFDATDELVRNGARFAVALGMEEDQFKAVRFSLLGSTYALDWMLSSFFQRALQLEEQSLRAQKTDAEYF